jgi:hypothetical protein
VGARGRALVPTRSQSVAELAYGFIYKMIEDVTGRDGLRFFPYIMTIFMFVFFANILGLIPVGLHHHLAYRGHGGSGAGGVHHGHGAGLRAQRRGFLRLFWVDSAPLALRPVLALIELISYFVRPVSHSIRLAGAMMAGHAVAKVFAGFAAALGAAFFPDPRGDRTLCAGAAGCGHPGLCLHHPDLRLSQGRAASASLTGRVPFPPIPISRSEHDGRRYRKWVPISVSAWPAMGMGGAAIGVGNMSRATSLPARCATRPRPLARPRCCSSASPSPKRWDLLVPGRAAADVRRLIQVS